MTSEILIAVGVYAGIVFVLVSLVLVAKKLLIPVLQQLLISRPGPAT